MRHTEGNIYIKIEAQTRRARHELAKVGGQLNKLGNATQSDMTLKQTKPAPHK